MKTKNLITFLKRVLAIIGCAALPSLVGADTFQDAEASNGILSTWFGPVSSGGPTIPDEGWVLHGEHGYLYFVSGESGLWFYDYIIDALGGDFTGWGYSDPEVFPFIYLEGSDLWVLYAAGVTGPEETPRIFLETNGFSAVLLPAWTQLYDIIETALNADDFNSLAAAITRADLIGALQGEGPFTVFAPTDAAFSLIDEATLNALLTDDELIETLTDILLYHVVAGYITAEDLSFDPDSVFNARNSSYYLQTLSGADIRFDVTPLGVILNGEAMVTVANIETDNGLIHVIDRVILPPKDIVNIAIDAGFESLAAAITQAELVETLQSDGPFTVFAPIDEAFAALGTETIDSLFDNANRELLAGILTYHVISGKIYSNQVAPGTEATTVNGATVAFSLNDDGELFINDARIIGTDVIASNGVIHIIENVILPPAPQTTTVDIGFDSASFNYTINGTSGASVTMKRGENYTFLRGDFSGHPFALSTVAPGSGWSESDRYGDSPNLTQTGQTIVYTPGSDTPDTIYYRCTVHASMGGVINVTD